MLDAEHSVVARSFERSNELVPPWVGVTVTERDVAPRAVLEVAAGRRIDHAVDAGNVRVDPRVLRVAVVHRVAERMRGRDRIGAHPHEMAWIQIRAHGVANSI